MSYELVSLERTELAQNIADRLGKELYGATLQQFADGELCILLDEPQRYVHKTAVILQSTGGRVNEYTLGVAFLAQALKQAGARRVIAVTPYLGYSRQDRTMNGKPGHMEIVACLFEQAGVDELIAVELHAKEIMQFFTIPVTDVSVKHTIAARIAKQFPALEMLCLVAPDKGAHVYVQAIAQEIGVGVIKCSKERFEADKTRLLDCAVDCDGSIGVIVDDIISTGGTVLNVATLLKQRGYRSLFCFAVHPVLAGNTVERIKKAGINALVVSNSISLSVTAQEIPFITVFDISEDIVFALKNKLGT